MKLRYYQEEAIQSIYRFFGEVQDVERNPVIAMPTGILASAFSDALQRQREEHDRKERNRAEHGGKEQGRDA